VGRGSFPVICLRFPISYPLLHARRSSPRGAVTSSTSIPTHTPFSGFFPFLHLPSTPYHLPVPPPPPPPPAAAAVAAVVAPHAHSRRIQASENRPPPLPWCGSPPPHPSQISRSGVVPEMGSEFPDSEAVTMVVTPFVTNQPTNQQ
jgi:hypothetical protein